MAKDTNAHSERQKHQFAALNLDEIFEFLIM